MRVSLQRACLLGLMLLLALAAVAANSSDAVLDAAVEGPCVDVKPKGSPQYTCAQQKAWGKCGESWMRGYCKKTCGTCGGSGGGKKSGGGGKKSGGGGKQSGGSSTLRQLNINAAASRTAPMKSYGGTYRERKGRILRALRATGMGEAKARMCLAIAMLETNNFDPESRDKKKTGDSTNYSQFNINRDMLTRIGISTDGLNTWSGLPKVASALKKMIENYGINGFLNYLRGGYTAWKDGRSYGAAEYRNGIASMVKMIDANPSLLTDDRRIDMVVGHV